MRVAVVAVYDGRGNLHGDCGGNLCVDSDGDSPDGYYSDTRIDIYGACRGDLRGAICSYYHFHGHIDGCSDNRKDGCRNSHGDGCDDSRIDS